ncbi:MAG: hypothetical protein HYV62_03515, partial [Candidatus Rokubacteria bacterium]|nr:hypothetical protein [Candidatus Rokubacteria bacterium]
ACRGELLALRETWALLGQWPETSPAEAVRARVVRGVRRQLLRESVLTVRGWVPAVLAAAIGVGLSLGMSLLVPYAVLVALCRETLAVSDLHAAPYVLAGASYGIPLAVAVWALRKRLLAGSVVGSLESSALFLVILSPYVIAACRDFAPPLRAAFVAGLAGGAVLWSLAGLGAARLGPLGRKSA